MNAAAESLWRRAREALKARGWSFAPELTPLEAATVVLEAVGDARVLRFVKAYHYPAAYGNRPEMPDAEAEALVAELEHDGPRPPSVLKVYTRQDLRCSLCGNPLSEGESGRA